MPKDTNENFDSLNEETFISELEALDEDAWKEKVLELVRKHNEFGDNNRQLFQRAKKSEGELKELKAKADESDKKPKVPKESDNKLIERLDKMALQVAGITEADEVELFDKWKNETGREADVIVGNSIFKKELEDMRITKANLKATSEIKGGTGESSAKSTPEYWIAKATKGEDGKLRFPEETPKELYPKIVAKIGEGEPAASRGKLSFYNS